jgi:hypothetical protein
MSTDISEEHFALNFKSDEYAKQETSMKEVASKAALLLGLPFNIKVTGSSETPIDFQLTARLYIPESPL